MPEVGVGTIPIHPDFKDFSRRLSAGLNRPIDDSANYVESKLGGAFRRVATIAGGIVAAKFGVDAFRGMIQGASDLNETLSKSNTIFGDQAKAIESWASGAARGFGQSKQGALDAAATFGNLFVQLGIGRDQAAQMSQKMVELASDFASFHNADPTEVIQAQTAAFRGEYDAVQRFVPTINAAAVEQKALEMGLGATTKELDAQDKALATQALLMEGAGAAVGDFARTSDGLANRQRILAAQFQDTKDRLGTALLPIVLTVMEAFLNFGSAISGPVKRAFETIKDVAVEVFNVLFRGDFTGAGPFAEDSAFISGLFRFREILGGVIGFVRDAVDAIIGGFQNPDAKVAVEGAEGLFLRLGAAIRTVAEFVRDNFVPIMAGAATLLAGRFALSVGTAVASMVTFVTNAGGLGAALTTLAGGPVGIIILAIAAFVAALVALYQKNEDFRSFVQEAWGAVSGFIATAWSSVIQPVWNAISGFISNVLIPGALSLWQTMQTVWDGITGVVTWAWDNVLEPTWQVLKLGVQGLIAVGRDLFEIWDRVVWRPLAATVEFVWNNIIRPIWDGMVQFINDVLLPPIRVIKEVAEDVFGAFWRAAQFAFDQIGKVVGPALRGIGTIVNGFLRVVANIADVVGLDHVAGVLRDAADAAANWGHARGGVLPVDVAYLARGGVAPFVTDGIRAIVGEGDPRYPEYVLATDPHYRRRNEKLWREYGARTGLLYEDLGRRFSAPWEAPQKMPMYQTGGILGFRLPKIDLPDWANPVEWAKAGIGAVRKVATAALERLWPKLGVPDHLGGIPPAAINSVREKVIDTLSGKTEEVARSTAERALVGAGGVSGGIGGGSVGQGWRAITNYLDSVGEPYTITSTTGGRHTPGSYHYVGKAVDMVSGNMMRVFNVLTNIGGSLAELFYDPAGWSIKNGQRVNWTVGGHEDHVHAATFDAGGVLKPGWNRLDLYNGTGAPERLAPVDMLDTDALGAAFGRQLEGMAVVLKDGTLVGHLSRQMERRRITYQR